ncbi:OmpA family protein [Rhizobium tumorigenes]|uniref:OmpA family protein n=1 Tax=Rhizobium tumorigenes TaxID=2041385 RepID=A0AAF1K9S1_9HYPH|nr:OmpA family protein [Rhizobium tumorigenes]WFR97024.1 OmpA family protein [Rhizobium tumorigenes]
MGTRSRLFASAAFPLLSLSLMLQPVHAAMLVGGTVNTTVRQADNAASFEVAQATAEPAEDEQDPKKKKKPGAEEPGKEPPKAEKHGEPEAPRPPKAEKPAEPEAPKAEKPAEPKAEKPVEPKAEKPAEPEAPKPPKAEKPVEMEAPKPPKAEKPAEPEAAPAKPKVQELEAPKPPKAEKPAAAEPEAQPETKKPAAEAPAVRSKAAEAPAAEPAAPAQQPAGKHQKPAEANGEAAPAPATPGEKPVKPGMPAEKVAPNAEKPPVPAADGAAPAKPAAEQPPAAAGQRRVAPGAEPVAPGAEPVAPDKPAPGAAVAPAANGAAPAAVAPAAPSTAGEQVSPAELQRRQKIAENPAAAGAGSGPVILPVQNGTAVLDSDKDAARRGHRGQPGAGQPGAPGQPPAPGQPVAAAPGQPAPPAPANVRAPTSDADAQRAAGGNQAPPVKMEAVTSEQGRRMDRQPDYASPQGVRIDDRQDNRVIVNFGDNVFVRHDDTQRFVRDGERPVYEQLPRDRYRETIDRPDGDRIITVRNRYGDIIQRSRIDARGREYVLFYSPELENTPDQDDYYRDPGDELPPMRLRIPLNQYIIDTSADQDQDYYDFLRKPPVEPVERVYSLNEVRYSARLRDKVRRIDLDTITFATGSAEIPMEQAKTLRGIADAIGNIVKKDPTETFLIEGHTDAVGTPQSNLILSDQRAESVANVLTDVYGIPPENLATQGYGEQYLKINTPGPEQENRRVTIRRVTALVRPVAVR